MAHSRESEQSTIRGITRAEVAKRLGVSTSTIRRLEYDRLFPVKDGRGVHRFDPEEVEKLAAASGVADPVRKAPRRPRLEVDSGGRLAARVFGMFSRRMSLQQIVMATRQPPAVIRDLYREWATTLEEGEWNRRSAADEP